MSEWTSISLKESQKEQLKEDKPDDLSMGKYLVSLVNSNSIDPNTESIDVDIESVIRESIEDLDLSVERTDSEKTADVLVERLMQKLKGLDEDMKNAAYEGAKEAVEEVAR